jgi:hypothetical protein
VSRPRGGGARPGRGWRLRRSGLAGWRRRRRVQAVADGRGSVGDTLAELARVALAIPAAALDWPGQCGYYACRSKRAGLLLSVLIDLDPSDRRAVHRAAEALWDALEHCPVSYDRQTGP